jgi:L-lactate dehydrogenase complex protein LldG
MILARLRAAAPAPVPPLADVGAWYTARARGEDAAQRLARFTRAIEAARAEVHEASAANWRERLFAVAAAKGVRTLLIGATAAGAALEAENAGRLKIVRYDKPIETWRDELFAQIDAGFTLARGAIAETGSLIVWPSVAEPRLISLVPALHFVLLDARTIHADLHSAISSENWPANLPTNALLISGPSKTSDIQQTVAYGAHGPRELVVFVLREDA